jgi:hypothetical protein
VRLGGELEAEDAGRSGYKGGPQLLYEGELWGGGKVPSRREEGEEPPFIEIGQLGGGA